MLETKRLILRQWEDEDYPHFARMCADPMTMKFFPKPLSVQESNELADKIRSAIDENGWGFWAVEDKATSQFIGFVGLHYQDATSGLPNAPFLEVGWRLSKTYWHKGYATEAAEQALRYAFYVLDFDQVYAFTAKTNLPSQEVMNRLGMVNTCQDFNHPSLPTAHQLAPHCLYQIERERFLSL
ncbi:GNAT family N-acetyltransferase [Vibrio intestinalis]|uniref:GNAT family N-acetyltransferase n=1 Tax=Vibrio intestinalis TaxID=2933291 RepID=UPI0021A5268E|nr:GNAT family N-acetyltransferase [Vibrio intestinalis]